MEKENKVKYVYTQSKLTPKQKVDEWLANSFCPYNDPSRCSEFGDNCIACLTELANSKNEWDPMGI